MDQGIRNFAITAVDKIGNEPPRVVGVELYDLRKLGLGEDVKQVKAASIVVLLSSRTKLLNWMQQRGTTPLLPHVDRVVVHIEQMAKANKFHMEFGINLGSELQRQVDPLDCIVKLSQPNIHRANGPMFKLGAKIVRKCNLVPSVYGDARQMENQEALLELLKTTSRRKAAPLPPSDVEPDDDDSEKAENTDIGKLHFCLHLSQSWFTVYLTTIALCYLCQLALYFIACVKTVTWYCSIAFNYTISLHR